MVIEVLIAAGTFLGGIGVWEARNWRRRVHGKRDAAAELEAKDLTIETNEQEIRALRNRVATLGSEVDRLERRTRELATALDAANTGMKHLEARYEVLRQFAAPEAFRSIDLMLRALVDHSLNNDEKVLLEARLADSTIPPDARRH